MIVFSNRRRATREQQKKYIRFRKGPFFKVFIMRPEWKFDVPFYTYKLVHIFFAAHVWLKRNTWVLRNTSKHCRASDARRKPFYLSKSGLQNCCNIKTRFLETVSETKHNAKNKFHNSCPWFVITVDATSVWRNRWFQKQSNLIQQMISNVMGAQRYRRPVQRHQTGPKIQNA